MKLLDGRSAFVTGSTQGVGREMAVAISKAGGSVILHGLHNDDAAKQAIEACDGDAKLVTGDLASNLPACVTDVADKALAISPEIDLLVCNAGTCIDVAFLDMDFEAFDRTLKLNVYSQFALIQHFAKRWHAAGVAGRIVITGSINGRLAEQCHVAYDTSKGAIDGMLRSLAVSLAPLGIRVNGVAPGLFRTPLTEPALKDPAFRKWMELHTPNEKVPGPEVIGGATVFLLSDGAEHVHGQMLMVDGGMSVWQQPDPPASWMAT